MKEALVKRNELKARKPKFTQQDAHKKDRLSDNWRNPRGRQSKVRLNIKGYVRSPSQGWRSPVAVRGVTRDGKVPVLVKNEKDLAGIDIKTQTAVISTTLGTRKKLALVKEAHAKKIPLHNCKAEDFIKKVEDLQAQKKKAKEDRTKSKEAKEKEKEATAKKKKDLEKAVQSEDDKKKEEKKELDKTLIHSEQ